MKHLITIILALASLQAFSQINVYDNPYDVAPATTNTTQVIVHPTVTKWVQIKFPASNSGTVQINSERSTITNSPVYSNTTHPNGIWIEVTYSFWVKLSNSADKIEVCWIK